MAGFPTTGLLTLYCIDKHVTFQLLQKTKYKFTVRVFISLRITCKKPFEPVPNPPNFKDEPGFIAFPPLSPSLWAGLMEIFEPLVVVGSTMKGLDCGRPLAAQPRGAHPLVHLDTF